MLSIRETGLLVLMTGAVLVMDCELWISILHCCILRAAIAVC
jgi:hypothetical protein